LQYGTGNYINTRRKGFSERFKWNRRHSVKYQGTRNNHLSDTFCGCETFFLLWVSIVNYMCFWNVVYKKKTNFLIYREPEYRSSILGRCNSGNFSLRHRVKTGSGPHPASYPMGTGGTFPGDKAAGASSWPLTSI
jgi:hypothetical protein